MGYDAACVDTMEMIMNLGLALIYLGYSLQEGNGEGWAAGMCVCKRGFVILLVDVCRYCSCS